MAKIKPEEESKLRVAGQKKGKLNLQIPAIKMPHDRLMDSLSTHTTLPTEGTDGTEPTNTTESTLATLSAVPTLTTQPTHATHPTADTERAEPVRSETAPVRDFYKRPNSIARFAIPDGWFPGKSLQLYEVFLTLTRGSIKPTRKVRLTKVRMMKLAGIGSRKTIDKTLANFKNRGLIRETFFDGEHEGNEFEVFTPDELGFSGTQSTQGSQGSHPTLGNAGQNVDSVGGLPFTHGSQGNEPINTGSFAESKTLFKDFLNPDDEKKIVAAIEQLHRAAIETTGTGLNRSNCEAFAELIDIFIAETGKAAARTNAVSVYGKFGVANLRRIINAKSRSSEKVKYFDPGKSRISEDEIMDYAPDSLTEDGRRDAVDLLRHIQSGESPGHVEWYRHVYTEEDWNWLMEQLEEGK